MIVEYGTALGQFLEVGNHERGDGFGQHVCFGPVVLPVAGGYQEVLAAFAAGGGHAVRGVRPDECTDGERLGGLVGWVLGWLTWGSTHWLVCG